MIEPHIKYRFKLIYVDINRLVYAPPFYQGAANEMKTYTQFTIMTRNSWKKLTECKMWFLKRLGFSYTLHLWKIKREKKIFP